MTGAAEEGPETDGTVWLAGQPISVDGLRTADKRLTDIQNLPPAELDLDVGWAFAARQAVREALQDAEVDRTPDARQEADDA